MEHTEQDKILYIMKQVFRDWNSFKRSMTLTQSENERGNRDKAMYHELNAYRIMNSLELNLRSLNSKLRNVDITEIEE